MKFVYLSNDFCCDVFPNNKPGEFTNYLNEELVLDGQWSVNLHEICYGTQSWHNVRDSNNKIHLRVSNLLDGSKPRKTTGRYDKKYERYAGPNPILECEIPSAEYMDGEDLMQEILDT